MDGGRRLSTSEAQRLLHNSPRPDPFASFQRPRRNGDPSDTTGAYSAQSTMEDSLSQAIASDPLPNSATFFEEQPIASNNDFETLTEPTQSRMTLTQSTPTVRGSPTASTRSLTGLVEAELPVSDSQASMNTQVRGQRDLSALFEPSLHIAEEREPILPSRRNRAKSHQPPASTHVSNQRNHEHANNHDTTTTTDTASAAPRRSIRLSLGSR